MYQTSYLSILDAIVDLQTRGYFFDFNMIGNKLLCSQQKIFLRSEDFDILEMYSFPHEDAWQETVVYGIESQQYHIKGILLSTMPERTVTLPAMLFKKISKFWV
jgi:hypothetical protein